MTGFISECRLAVRISKHLLSVRTSLSGRLALMWPSRCDLTAASGTVYRGAVQRSRPVSPCTQTLAALGVTVMWCHVLASSRKAAFQHNSSCTPESREITLFVHVNTRPISVCVYTAQVLQLAGSVAQLKLGHMTFH